MARSRPPLWGIFVPGIVGHVTDLWPPTSEFGRRSVRYRPLTSVGVERSYWKHSHFSAQSCSPFPPPRRAPISEHIMSYVLTSAPMAVPWTGRKVLRSSLPLYLAVVALSPWAPWLNATFRYSLSHFLYCEKGWVRFGPRLVFKATPIRILYRFQTWCYIVMFFQFQTYN